MCIHKLWLTSVSHPLSSFKWMGAGFFSNVVATFNHVGVSFNLFMATTGDVWIIPSFWIWDYVLHVEYVSCVITNCGQYQWVIPSPQKLFKLCWRKTLPKNYYPYLKTYSSNFHYSRLLSLYPFLWLSFLLTFFRLVCYYSLRLYGSRELVKFLESLSTDVELSSPMKSQLNGCPHYFMFLF